MLKCEGSGGGSDDDSCGSQCVKIRGLPWTATKEDIIDFFSDCTVNNGVEGVHLITSPEGRSSGEAFVEVGQDDDIANFIRKDKKTMGHRYIEVFKVKKAEMEWFLRRNRPNLEPQMSIKIDPEDCDTFVRLRGLPFECSKEDIQTFFEGLEMASNGIQLMVDTQGRSTGESYVQFSSKEQADKALAKDRQCIGHRYIEVFRVSPSELRSIQMLSMKPCSRGYSSTSRPSPYDRTGRRGDSDYHSRYDGGNGGGGRYSSSGGQRGGQRYYSKGFEDDSWSGYGNGSGSGGGSSWSSRGGMTPPPPPPPLVPGLKRGSSGGGGRVSGSGKNCVLMRGLPFKAVEDDIRTFFEPLIPTKVDIIYESSGRPSGTAKVQFASGDDLTRAMAKHKERMEHRYIELFVHSL